MGVVDRTEDLQKQVGQIIGGIGSIYGMNTAQRDVMSPVLPKLEDQGDDDILGREDLFF